MRKIARVDNNQVEIVKALRDCGASVAMLHQVGNGCPDIIVGFQGENYLLEIKYKSGRLTDEERYFHESWKGNIGVVYSIEEALAIIGVVRD